MRKMATVRRVSGVQLIPQADKICAYIVDGWSIVDAKDKYNVGDLVVMCEIDSWIPHEIAPFLSKGKEPREFEGVKGERLKTIKLRGQLSQGLLLPPSVLGDTQPNFFNESDRWALGVIAEGEDQFSEFIFEGDDVSERLGIKKWERPLSPQLAGMARGSFPSFVPKTDQERVQNLVKEIDLASTCGHEFEITEKLDGSSMTVYLREDQFGVCSRNLDLKETEGNTFWATTRRLDIEAKMRAVEEFGDFAVQGELVGPGIQGNSYNLTHHDFYVFDVYDIRAGEYVAPAVRQALVARMGLKHVPIIAHNAPITGHDVGAILKLADGRSVVGDCKAKREGLVFKSTNGGFSFKAISNDWLLCGGE